MAADAEPSTSKRPPTVTVKLQALQDGSVSLETLEAAFGPDSLGIILVSDLPPEYAQLRATLLSYSSYLASLPEEELATVEVPQANYNVGWSRGRETLASGRYDTLKGSYYAAPVRDAALEARAAALYPHVAEFTTPNVWPREAALPGFEAAFDALCALVVDVAGYVARSCDRFGVARLDGYESGTLEGIVRGSVSTKARLLHYYPPPPTPSVPGSEGGGVAKEASAPSIDDDWCATHRDLGALTGLTSQMFVDETAYPPNTFRKTTPDAESPFLPPLPELPSHPDPRAGLWIQDRAGRATQVHIPRDCLAFQTGRALELLTRGAFKAVPHFVRGGEPGAAGAGIARNTLAVFTQPNLWEVVDGERDFAALGEFELRRTV